MIGLTMILMAVLFAYTFEAFLCLFSIGYGICNGLTYMVPMQHGWLWFPNKPGLVSGIIIGGFGIGTFVFSLVCTGLVNPDGIDAVDGKFPDSVNERVPLMLKVFTVSNICIVLLALILIFPGKDCTSEEEVKHALFRTSASQSDQNERIAEFWNNTPLVLS